MRVITRRWSGRVIAVAGWYFMAVFMLYGQDAMPGVNMPLDHYVYDLFERLESKGVISPSIELRNRPFTRNAVLRILRALESVKADRPDLFSESELGQLRKLKGEFHVEWLATEPPIDPGETKRHLLGWYSRSDSSGDYVLGDVNLEQNLQVSRSGGSADSLNETIGHTTVHGIARGVLKRGVAYYSDFATTMIKGSDIGGSNYQPTQQGIVTKTNNVYSLEANAYVVIEPRWFRLQFGKDKLVLGPGRHNNLFLSDHAPAFDNVRLDVTFERIKYTYFHGWLRSPRLWSNADSALSDRKYIAGHRLEFRVFPWLFFAGNESVVYGGRSLETQYLNPIMVYHVAEQYAGDKDNNTMSFDVTAFAGRGVKVYGALFLDDYRLADNPLRYWKQQWSVLLGAFWVDPFGIASTDVRFEYSRVEPFVYTHKFTLINYSHFERSLGSFLPPNSDDYFLEFRFQPSRKFLARGSYEWSRHGEGDIAVSGEELGYGQPGKMKKKFLMGIRETKHTVTISGTYELFRHQYAAAMYSLQLARNFENVSGRDFTRHFAMVGYRIDY